MQFWFRVRTCWFLTVVLTVKNAVWCSFWNVVICQNISVSVTATVSDMITLFIALYATMMYSLSSQTIRTTTVLMRMSALLDQGRLHWPHCWQEQSLSTSRFRYVQLLFSFFSYIVSSIGLVVWAVYDIWAVCLISAWCSEQVASAKLRRQH